MARKRRVTLRAQWLGQMLRELREQNDLKLKDAAEYLQRDIATVSRFELGTFPIRRGDVFALMDLYGVGDKPQREVLLQLAGEVWQTGWWEKYSNDDVWGATIDLVWLENRAKAMRSFCTLTVPGLLQTADYARSIMQVVNRGAPRQVERGLELRLARQEVLIRGQPPHFITVLDEAALRRPIGGTRIMAEQLRHLRMLASQQNIEVRALPFRVGAHASPEGAFTLIKLEDPFPEVAYIESPGGAMYLETGDADRLTGLYDQLQETSLSAEESIDFLAALEKDLR